MSCEKVDLGNGNFAITCGRGRPAKAAPCSFCRARPHTKLCDFELAPGRTCDRKMCDRCATSVGTEKDHCPNHNQVQLPWEKAVTA